MGQYYNPVCVDRMEYLYTHDYNNSLKLMAHSWMENNFMHAVCGLLIPGGKWYRTHIVWAGDYAEPERVEDYPEWDTKEWEDMTLYRLVEEKGEKIHPPATPLPDRYHYLVNYSNRLAIDLRACQGDDDGWIIHPLPLLSAEGNGRGDGDFRGEDERVGCWARDEIAIEDDLPEGFTLVDGTFRELGWKSRCTTWRAIATRPTPMKLSGTGITA